MAKRNSSGFVFISTLLFSQSATCFTCFFVVKSNAVIYSSNEQWCRLICVTVYH